MTRLSVPQQASPAVLSIEEFYGLRDVPPETEWFATPAGPTGMISATS